MSSATTRRPRRSHASHEEEEHENEERWLVSFADMMTLMFALFMVLFSISSVNTSKFEALKRSLSESFSPAILPGGKALMQKGADTEEVDQSSPSPQQPTLAPRDAVAAMMTRSKAEAKADAAAREERDFKALKKHIDAEAAKLGLADKVSTTIRRRGLAVRLITDGVLFDSGEGTLRPGAERLLTPLAGLLRREREHPIVVEGYTDTQPIASYRYPTNWELSGARAASVVRHFLASAVPVDRMTAQAYAYQHPVASNATPEGRSRNRRVEVVLARINTPATAKDTP